MLEADLNYLGHRIRVARETCGLTQKELALQTHLAVKTIQDIENGHQNPSYDTLIRLINRLGIPVESLFCASPCDEGELSGDFVAKIRSCDRAVQKCY